MSLPWRRFQLYFEDLMPEKVQQMPTAEDIRGYDNVVPFAPAETVQPSQGADDWWEGPLDQVLNRTIDGTTSYVDATRMDLVDANALAGKLR